MTLTYGGNLWTGAVLQRVLDDHVERGAAALGALLAEGERRRLSTASRHRSFRGLISWPGGQVLTAR
jgi:hypothetical protein